MSLPGGKRFMQRYCSRWFWAVGMIVALGASPLSAQDVFPTPSLEARTAEFEAIQQEAEWVERLNRQLKRVARFVRPTVVHIEAHKLDGRRTIDEAGSGTVVDIDGRRYVLTNRHVIKNAPVEQIKLRLADGRVFHPQSAWEDRGTDVAVLRLPTNTPLAARLGDSDSVEVGDLVLAVGSPFGLSHSITMGIISAKGRRDLKLGTEGVQYQNFFQTDAAINPGNSGGPLVNLRGEVIGVNTAIASNSGGNDGIGFSIPINIAIDIARQLVHTGSVTRAFLGVRLDHQYDEAMSRRYGLPRHVGARISRIEPGSAASRSDLQVGDIIIRYDGITIEDDKHLVNQVKLTPLGKRVEIVVLRDRQPVTVRVQMGTPHGSAEPVVTPSSTSEEASR